MSAARSGTRATQPHLTHLECTECGRTYDLSAWRGLCECGRPLAALYDLDTLRKRFDRAALAAREATLWRYREALPLSFERAPITLGEGWTPLPSLPALAALVGVRELLVKDEAPNPTGSFKARGLCLAVNLAHAFGARHVALPSAGNAGGALAAYAARAGLTAHVFVPEDCPKAFVLEARALGARVTLVPGFITDAGRRLREVAGPDWFDLSTLREPFRVEGKKTMGYEIAEQLGWTLPDVIVYPTGGGTGLVGMAKAFDELSALGWIDPARRPRLVSVQVEGCAPIPRAFERGAAEATPWADPVTLAAGLRVPAAVGDRWMLRVLRASGGTAVAVPETAMLDDTLVLSQALGILAAPEGGAALAGLRRLVETGGAGAGDRVVVYNTGSGLKYLEAIEAALARRSPLC
ncbi:MAG: threonine synthase [Candidatus Eiseniibacteriota bacterium]